MDIRFFLTEARTTKQKGEMMSLREVRLDKQFTSSDIRCKSIKPQKNPYEKPLPRNGIALYYRQKNFYTEKRALVSH